MSDGNPTRPVPEPDSARDSEQSRESLLAELAAVRSELATVKANQAQQTDNASDTRSGPAGWRWFPSGALIVIVALLAPVAVAATWAHSIVFDTDRYVATVAPLAEDPQLQGAVADSLTDQLLDYINVAEIVTEVADGLVDRGAPEQLAVLVGPSVSGIESLIGDAVDRVVTSDTFAAAWETANRTAHAELVAALTGDNELVNVEDGAVTVQTQAFVDAAKQALTDAGADGLAERIPNVSASFVVMQSDDLAMVQRGMRGLEAAGVWLGWVVLALAAIAILVAPNRRRAVVLVGLAAAVGILLLAVGLMVGRSAYLSAVDPELLPPSAAAALFDQVVGLLRVGVRATLVFALLVAFLAWVSGPGKLASDVRGVARGVTDRTRSVVTRGRDAGPVASTIGAYLRPLQIAVVVLAVGAVLFWPYPTAAVVVTITILGLLAVAVLEVLGGSRAEQPDATAKPV